MTVSAPVNVGVVGCGNISDIYLTNARWLTDIQIVGVTDLRQELAVAQAEKYQIDQIYKSVTDMLADPEIDLILNITHPAAHGPIAQQAVTARKSVYNEKPLTLDRAEGAALLDMADANNVLVGCAPDTFLGGGHQMARRLIDDGVIGRPVSANAFMMSWGWESWHPNPEFYYKPGGGPMFDMGPYYLTALVFLLGPIATVSGMVTTGRQQRPITSEPLRGQIINVEVPTHVTGLMHFDSGAVGTIITSFDAAGSTLPRIEIHGDEGSLIVPDPNHFGGRVHLRLGNEREWREIDPERGYIENARGLGLADMAAALRSGRPHRASGRLAYHVLDLMHAFHDSNAQGQHIHLTSQCAQPETMPGSYIYGQP